MPNAVLALATVRGDYPTNGRAGLDALHRALADFAPPPLAFAPRAAAPEPAPAPFSVVPEPAETPAQVEERIARAVAEAEARLRAQLEAEHREAGATALAQALATERQAHADALAEGLRAAGERAAEVIENRIAALAAAVEANLGAACGRLLVPLAGEALARRAVAEMTEAVRDALKREGRPRIAVSGPASLLDGLRARLGENGDGDGVEWHEADGFDLQLAFEGQVIETRLGLWAERLRAELGGDPS